MASSFEFTLAHPVQHTQCLKLPSVRTFLVYNIRMGRKTVPLVFYACPL